MGVKVRGGRNTPNGETMMDRLVFVLVVLAIPATTLATVFRWLSVEYALGFVWAVVLLTVALGLWRMWQGAEDHGRRASNSPWRAV